jgi:hypothetical protein
MNSLLGQKDASLVSATGSDELGTSIAVSFPASCTDKPGDVANARSGFLTR